MSANPPLIVLVVLICIQESISIPCLNVDTSEGPVTLQHGQTACAPLLDGEIKATDQGRRFVICSYGYVFVQFCPGALRFNVAAGICHWPAFGDCIISGHAIDETQTTASTATNAPTTTLQTTTSSPKTVSPITASPTTTSPPTSPPTTASPTTASTTTAPPTSLSPKTTTNASTTTASPTTASSSSTTTATTSPTTASTTTASPTTASTTTASSTKTSQTTVLSTNDSTNSPTTTMKQYSHVVSTAKPTQHTTNVSNQQTTTQLSPTQTEDRSSFAPKTTQNVINPSTSKDIQNTTNIPTNQQTVKTTSTTKALIYSTTPRVATTKTITEIPNTSNIPIYSTTQISENTKTSIVTQNETTTQRHTTTPIIQTTSQINTTTPIIQTTSQINTTTPIIQTTSQINTTTPIIQTTSQINTTTPIIQTTSQINTTTPIIQTTSQINTTPIIQTTSQINTTTPIIQTTSQINTTSKTTASFAASTIDVNAKKSTKAPLVRQSTTRSLPTTSSTMTSATPTTPQLTTTSKTTASSTIDVSTVTSSKDQSTGQSTTATSSRPITTDKTSSGPNTPDDSEYIDPCNWETCQLPQCSCYGARPNISLADTPMFLLLTFDGPLTSELYNGYYEMLMVDNGNRFFNQNGCPFRSTVFLSGVGSDYSAVNTLAEAGHEIASGTLTNTLPLGDSNADYNDTLQEIDGLRKKVLEETKRQQLLDSIVGFRAPNLRTARDVQFDVLKDNQFLYDSSISNIEIYSTRDPVWPYTMDFGVVQCPNPPCPSSNYSGLWEIPLNSWLGEDGQSCDYVNSCSVGANVLAADENDWYNLFKNNFETYFYPAKTPMHISVRTSTPTENLQLEQALVRWVDYTLSSYNNVWVVTHKMVIDWIRDPLTNSQMVARKWGC